MKLFFESWRKYLKEAEESGPLATTQIQKPKIPEYEGDEYTSPYEYADSPDKTKENYFGADPDSLSCIKNFRNQKAPARLDAWKVASQFYTCMEDNGYKELGAGSFRAVFSLPDNPDIVLKTVVPNNTSTAEKSISREMNRKEAQASYQTTSELVPKVFDSAKDHLWIISEKVTPLRSWAEMENYFPTWKELKKDGLFGSWYGDDFGGFFYELIRRETEYGPIRYIIFRELQNKYDTLGLAEPIVEKEADAIAKKLINRSKFAEIRDLLAQFDIPSWDIVPRNVGYAIRDGKKQFVILDPGFELGKEKHTVKGQTKSPNISDIFKDKYGKTWEPEKTKKAVALTEKLMLVADLKNPNGWNKYRELVAKAYDEAPPFDESAVSSFEAIEPFVDKMFKRISSRVDVQFVDEDPYEGPEEMCDDALNNGILKIWSGGTEHQIFNPELNLKLRAVHDYMAHCQKSTDFTMKGEVASYNAHMKTVPPAAAGALFTEVVGQAAFFLDRGYFPPQKIAILEGFDFFNVGEVDPEITGYKLDPEKKELIKVDQAEEFPPSEEKIEEQNKSYQDVVKKRHRKMKIRLIGKGKNTYNVGGKMKKPSYRRAKSAPVGAGGS